MSTLLSIRFPVSTQQVSIWSLKILLIYFFQNGHLWNSVMPSNDDPDDQLLKSWNSAARKRAMVCIDVIIDRNCESGEIIWRQFGNEWTFHFLFHFEGIAVGHEMFRIHNFDKYSWYYFDPAWLKLELPKSRKVASPLHSIFDQFPQVKTFGIYNAPNNEILIQNTKYAETKCF